MLSADDSEQAEGGGVMDELIKRQDALDALCDACTLARVKSECFFKKQESCMDHNAILDVPAVGEQWIPCSERLPEKKRKTYWVCTDTEYQCECRWTNNRYGIGESDNWGWSYFDVPQYTEVIAWMPLPEPYKGEQE